MKHIKWFDLEISDGIMNSDIKEMTLCIFKCWKNSKISITGKQKLTEWRPKYSVALVTTLEELRQLYNRLKNEDQDLNDYNMSVLYEDESVLRVRIA